MKGRVQTSGTGERGLNDWVAPLFAFEFKSITHSIGRIRVVSETSGPLRYRLPQAPWAHKLSAPAFCAESAVVPFISEPVIRRGHEWKRGRSPTRTEPIPATHPVISTHSPPLHLLGSHSLPPLPH